MESLRDPRQRAGAPATTITAETLTSAQREMFHQFAAVTVCSLHCAASYTLVPAQAGSTFVIAASHPGRLLARDPRPTFPAGLGPLVARLSTDGVLECEGSHGAWGLPPHEGRELLMAITSGDRVAAIQLATGINADPIEVEHAARDLVAFGSAVVREQIARPVRERRDDCSRTLREIAQRIVLREHVSTLRHRASPVPARAAPPSRLARLLESVIAAGQRADRL
jgi:hypothetical protein